MREVTDADQRIRYVKENEREKREKREDERETCLKQSFKTRFRENHPRNKKYTRDRYNMTDDVMQI